jgi:hypothetical protein
MKKNTAGQRVHFSLFKNGSRVENPTLAAGDAKVAIDGGAQANVNTLPTSDAAGLVTWQPTQAETNGDVVTLLMLDAAGDEWEPVTQAFYTTDNAAVWEETAEGGHDYGDVMRIVLAVLAGRSIGGGTNTVAFRDVANSKDRVRVQVDSNGNRTLVITLDGT